MSDASEKLENKAAMPKVEPKAATASQEQKAEPGTAVVNVAPATAKTQAGTKPATPTPLSPDQLRAQEMAQVQAEVDSREADESDVEGGKYYVGGYEDKGKRVGGRWVNAEGQPIKGLNNDGE
jgi:hypothetical protein